MMIFSGNQLALLLGVAACGGPAASRRYLPLTQPVSFCFRPASIWHQRLEPACLHPRLRTLSPINSVPTICLPAPGSLRTLRVSPLERLATSAFFKVVVASTV